ncbi:uncharacterized protein EV420DRAFT_1134176 [Desarmillaria tabescens]|uniref:Uncharacterized protein n=1 Tax=Armillaria tabescens TaxID=1929756 RepID=A0AA39JCU7_ARMTA|nr:uncharacterized protein EV420DRAFT_1134176 [Desarmillaria tabescens]KAK0440421.1 hypothetical protein EV420DRAFT_1134176 [Desarmillaria tabescens]
MPATVSLMPFDTSTRCHTISAPLLSLSRFITSSNRRYDSTTSLNAITSQLAMERGSYIYRTSSACQLLVSPEYRTLCGAVIWYKRICIHTVRTFNSRDHPRAACLCPSQQNLLRTPSWFPRTQASGSHMSFTEAFQMTSLLKSLISMVAE